MSHRRDRKKHFNHFILWVVSHIRACLYGFGELVRAPLASLMTIAVIGVAIALPAGFYLFLQNFQLLSKLWNGHPTISLYLKLNTSEEAIKALTTQLKNRGDISRIQYISPAMGLDELKKSMALENIVDTLSSNPLPPVIVISPANSNPNNLQHLLSDLKTLPTVDVAQLDLAWVKRLRYFITLGKRITYVIAILFGIGVILIIGNTIRLTTESQRQEIMILKLVGATSAFIRRPLLYRGFFYGLLGGTLAWLFVSLMLFSAASPAAHLAATYNNHCTISGLSFQTGMSIILFSILMGLGGSWLVTYRHLNAAESL